MTYVLQASPLSRIWASAQERELCLADPKRLTLKTPFEVFIPRACGAIVLTHNKPTLASSLLTKTKEREVSEDEVSPLVAWLTDERNQETDIYGVVSIPIQENIADAFMSLVHEENDKARAKLVEETRKRMADGIIEARKIADARVMRACGKMYSIVKSTVESMKKDGKGIYSPSYAEALALEVMKDTIKGRRAPEEKAAKMMNSAMDQLSQPV